MPHRVLYLFETGQNTEDSQLASILARHHDPRHWEARALFLAEGPQVRELSSFGIRCQTYRGAPIKLHRPWMSLIALQKMIAQAAAFTQAEKIELIHPVGIIPRAIARTLELIHGVGVSPAFKPEPATATEVLPLDLAHAQELRECLGIRSDQVVFGLLGPLSLNRGHQLLIEAAAQVQARCPSARFLILGSPLNPSDHRHESEMRELARSSGLRDRVIFGGQTSSLRVGALACDVVLDCSLSPDGSCISIVEAMMLGKPVIAPRWGLALEIITPEGDGLLYDPLSSDDLADRMLELSGTNEERRSFGVAGRAIALERFDARRVAHGIENRFLKALKKAA